MNINLSFKIAKEDLLKAYRLAAKKPWWMRIPDYFFYLVILYSFFYQLVLVLTGYSRFLYSTIGMGLLILIYVIFRLVVFPRRVDRIYKTSPDLQKPTEMIISEEGVKFVTENSHIRRDWGRILAWKENNDFLLLYMSENSFAILPLRDMGDSPAYSFIKQKISDSDIPYKKIPTGAIFATILFTILGVLILSVYLT
jgi:hypothetical protein